MIIHYPKNTITIHPSMTKHGEISAFLYQIQIVFNYTNKLIPEFCLNLSNVKEVNMLSVLLIYKFMEFSINNNCFKEPIIFQSPYFKKRIEDFGFKELLKSILTEKEKRLDDRYLGLKAYTESDVIIAPHALLRSNIPSHLKLNSEYLPKIRNYYSKKGEVEMIFQCLSEIVKNFWTHAIQDDRSIIFACGNNQKIEIACVDTGEGIISSMAKSIEKPIRNKSKILKMALSKGITSKKNTHHMGFGLWMMDRIVDLNGGAMQVFSEGVSYHNCNGKKVFKESGFWKGTIIYLNLSLRNPITAADIPELEDDNKIVLNLIN